MSQARSAAERWVLPYCWDQRVLFLAPNGVSPCMRCSRAVKDSSAAFAFEGEGLLSSSRLNAASWSSHGCKDTGRMIKSALEVSTYRVSIRQISKVLVLCYKSHFITFSCCHDHLQRHQVVITDTANEFSTKLQREWSDQIALKMCTKLFPKIGRYGQHNIQRCIVHTNKKQTIPKIWKYWITSTMSWHWNANCNIENPSVASF